MFIGNDLYRVYYRGTVIAVLSTAAQVEALCALLQYSYDMAMISVKYGTGYYKLKSLFNTILSETNNGN